MTGAEQVRAARAQIVDAAHRLAAQGLSPGSSSNLSARVGDQVAITATGAHMATLTSEQVSIVSLHGELIDGDLAPTSELELHLGVYRAAPAGAVVHTHSAAATTLSLVIDELPVIHYEQLLLGGTVRVAPFAVFGTPALAANVHAALEGRKAAIMANHGAVTWGTDLGDAVRCALLLEWVSALYLRARSLGEPKTLSLEEQQGVIAHAMRTGYGSTQRAAPAKDPS